MRIVKEIVSYEISETKNSAGDTSSIVTTEKDFRIGENIVFVLKKGNIERYFPFFVKKVSYDSKTGLTTLECVNPIAQLQNCLLADIKSTSGEISDIIYNLLTEAKNRGYIDFYINRRNIATAGISYGNVPVSTRFLLELFQDFCTLTGYDMWVGYDAVNEQYNAFFFKPKITGEETPIVLKEGVNILHEDIQRGDIEDVRNYIVIYYYPTKEPSDDRWSEGGSGMRFAVVPPREVLMDGLSKTLKSNYALCREVRIRNSGPIAKTTKEYSSSVPTQTIEVDTTSGFLNSGYIWIPGMGEPIPYTSKTDKQFNLAYEAYREIPVNTEVYQYKPTEWITDHDYESPFEMLQIIFLWNYVKITKIGIYIWGISGTPGPLNVYLGRLSSTHKKYTIANPTIGWNFIDVDYDVDIPPEYDRWSLYVLYTIFLTLDQTKTNNDYYTIGMGPSFSLDGAQGEIFYAGALGGYTPGNWEWENFNDPNNMPAVYIESLFDASITPLWQGTGKFGSKNHFIDTRTGKNKLIAKEGVDCLRFFGYNTVFTLNLNSPLDLANFDRIHFWYQGDLMQIKLICTSGYYSKTLSKSTDWSEQTIPISTMNASTPSGILKAIEFTVNGNAFVDGLCLSYPSTGLTVIKQDLTSIQTYKQRAEILYAKGVTSSSYALFLAEKILQQKKEPQVAGTILTNEDFYLSPRNSVRVIIPSKDIDGVFEIYQAKHSNGLSEITIGSFVFDLKRELAMLNSSVKNFKIAVGTAGIPSEEKEQTTIYLSHNFKHQAGGQDEINVTGLRGVLNDEQKSSWEKLTNKPASSIEDIDNAVANRHTHTNKSILDTFTQPEANFEKIANKGVVNGYASLDSNALVVQNPANASTVPEAFKIPISDANKKLDAWITRTLHEKVFKDTEIVTALTDPYQFCIPPELDGYALKNVSAYVSTPSTSGSIVIQIKNVTRNVDMLSTKITIEENEKTSYTATIQPVVDATYRNVAKGDIIAIIIESTGTGAKGLGVNLSFEKV